MHNSILATGLGLVFTLSLAGSGTATAVPVSYQIGAGSTPGFSGSWLHSARDEMGDSGFYTNGEAMRITGELTIDMESGDASGRLSGKGNFGLGSSAMDDWLLVITGGSKGTHTFNDGEKDLLTLNYVLTSKSGYEADGAFNFADRDFNGGNRDNGPNYINENRLYLWGNNWVNNGDKNRDWFVYDEEGNALGLDLYGTAPEPGLLMLMATGLMGIGFSARLRRKKS